MRQKTDCFIACRTLAEVEPAIEQLRRSNSVRHIFLLVSEELANEAVAPQDCSFVVTDNLSSTQFVITHNRIGSEVNVTLDVYDISGRQVWRQTETLVPSNETFTVDWNLNVAGGSRLHTGLYLCRFCLNGSETKTVKVLVKH